MRYILLIISLLCTLFVSAQTDKVDKVKVVVTDSLTGERIPFASILYPGTDGGTLCDNRGVATVIFRKSDRRITAQVLGYAPKTVTVPSGRKNFTIPLSPTSVTLKEVTVRRSKEKYHKKNNPAVAFAQSIKDRQHLTDPRRHPYYNYSKYERITMGINDFVITDDDSWLGNKFGFLKNHVDTNEVTGRPVLTLSVREKTSDILYRRNPESEREYVTGTRRAGIDDVMSNQENLSEMLSDVFREVDLYQNDITLMQNRFVSPLGRIATDFYKFYLTDTVQVGDDRCIVLSFAPHNLSSFGFTGRVYVPINDTTMFIKKVEMRAPNDINLNFIQNLYINQEYERADDGSRLRSHDDMVVSLQLMPGTPSVLVRRNIAYSDHNFEPSP
ncbi:MAG: DUF5686 and carboxypeptidase regulatory-like domain-containing protein, partial [Muribaculaceae bacterium]|nr:DUF5686 and carboxypeptidase regulatory-like domain-containing protein [Muribaculaceae bacterium]